MPTLSSNSSSTGHAAAPLGRQYGEIKVALCRHGYDSWTEEMWVPDANGPLIRSNEPGKRLHAPIFDIDQPVVFIDTNDGTTLHVDVNRRRLLRKLRVLVRGGHMSAADADALRRRLREQIRLLGPVGPVELRLAHPVRVVASRTPGHYHLYIDTRMKMRASVRLARQLGFVDKEYIKASRQTGYWVGRRPA